MRSKPGTNIVVRLAVLVALVIITAVAVTAPGPKSPAPRITVEIQHFSLARNPRAPADFTFVDGTGRTRGLADYRGQVVLVNFWATWCAPCVREMPSLDRLAARLKGRPFALVALNVDREGAAKAAPFLARLGLVSTALYLDPGGRAQRALKVGALPSSILFDAKGRELGRLTGQAEWDAPEAVALITHFLAAR